MNVAGFFNVQKQVYGNTLKSNPFGDSFANKKEQSDTTRLSDDMRKMVRSLYQTSLTNERAKKAQENGFLQTSGAPDSSEEELLEKEKYNYKDVSTKIQQAKTSSSAGQAVIAAKRKVLEIKRKISSGKGDAKELQLALTHAKRMEMVARKKKHHLELEELVENTQKRDEKLDKMEEASQDIRQNLTSVAEEKVYEAEDAIFEEREDMLDETMEAFEDSGLEVSEDMMAELNQMISEFGEEELRELEESMEMLENMEVIDPHMSKEDLEDLKRKHRSAEMKAMVKADMDYLKEMIKYTMQKGGSIPGMPSSGPSATPSPVAVDAAPVAMSMPSGDVATPSFDMQI